MPCVIAYFITFAIGNWLLGRFVERHGHETVNLPNEQM